MNNETTGALEAAKAAKKKEEIEPISVKGQLAFTIRKAREDFEYFHYDKADAADGLAAVRYFRNEFSPSEDNYNQVKKGLDCIENAIYNLLYYIGLMESEEGNAL
ncbi:MAG: hypothetical protein UH241_08235 [Acutalibacteraceae bacterium]|jgi:hypothetical protein|nr:hypothetical protein [Acutalibacteraceae bacterium]